MTETPTARDRQTVPKEGQPHCWIQWKGTNVCMDFHCKCGYFGHVDEEFAYHLRCPNCSRVFMCNGHIELVELRAGEKPEPDIVKDVPFEPDGVPEVTAQEAGALERTPAKEG